MSAGGNKQFQSQSASVTQQEVAEHYYKAMVGQQYSAQYQQNRMSQYEMNLRAQMQMQGLNKETSEKFEGETIDGECIRIDEDKELTHDNET